MADFDTALRVGKLGEDAVMDLCLKSGKTPAPVQGKFKPYDFIVLETKLAYEVKRDWKLKYIGNLVVEIEMPVGQPSGLQTTFADYWVFDTPDEYIFITPERLKDILSFWDFRASVFVGDGDRTAKKAYLIPTNLIKEMANKVKVK